jgi:nucleotide-binding universal stress UspA family protein
MKKKDRFSILHLVDYSAAGRVAFEHALRIAVILSAELTLVLTKIADATENDWPHNPPVRKTLKQWNLIKNGNGRDAVLNDLKIAVKKINRSALNPSAALAYHLETHDVDLIVLSHRLKKHLEQPADHNFFLKLLQQTAAQVLFVPENASGFVSSQNGAVSLSHIMVPVVREPNPESAIKDAAALGYAMGSDTVSISLVHVGDASGVPAVTLPAYAGCAWNQVLREGEAASEINALAYVLPADLIVMTSRSGNSNGGSHRESVTARVLQKAPCPVLVLAAA